MSVPAIFVGEELHCTGHTKRQPTLAPGTCHWEFYENDPNGIEAALYFVCPCGCGEVDFVFASTKKPAEGRRCASGTASCARGSSLVRKAVVSPTAVLARILSQAICEEQRRSATMKIGETVTVHKFGTTFTVTASA